MYTVSELWDAARSAGFSPAQSVIAVAISLAEDSTRNPNASHHNTDGTTDYGPWQINSVHADIIRKYGNPYNLQDNARMAYAVYQAQGWGAWSTYNSGAYRAHLSEAKNVAKKKGVSVPKELWHTLTNGAIGNAQDLYHMATTGQLPSNTSPFSGLAQLGSLAGHLTDSGMWKRIGIGALAVLLILIGVVFMVESNKSARSVTEMAALA